MATKTNEEKLVGCLAGLLAAIVAIPVSTAISGWALKTLWGWFFVPILHLPPLGILQAVGVALVVRFLTAHKTPAEKDKSVLEATVEGLIFVVLYSGMAVATGWIVLHLMK